MPYHDPTKPLLLQQRDRLRDLLEADDLVRAVYPAPRAVRGLWRDDVTSAEGAVLSVAPVRVRFGQAATGVGPVATYEHQPTMLLIAQVFGTGQADEVPVEVFDELLALTEQTRLALLRYLGEPAPLAAGPGGCRLWDTLEFLPDTTTYEKHPSKSFWYSTTLFRLYSYQRGV